MAASLDRVVALGTVDRPMEETVVAGAELSIEPPVGIEDDVSVEHPVIANATSRTAAHVFRTTAPPPE
ncbi:hypothetical protein [Nakamurella endophytica]|uniref:hypothetical protein n=1 Tax=Nakamurella endophytica TaxID=1748367 RepID=UPI00166971E4|nr:hypothetical protein [Nakamurella endophytica]